VSYVPEEKKRIEIRSVFKRNAQYLNESPWSKEDASINQIELITQWKLSDNLSFFGKVSRDENISLSRDLSYGIEYANCCLKIGVMKRKWQDQDFFIASSVEERIKIFESGRLPERERDNLYFFFELVELGRFGKRISDVLSSRKFQ
jgi:lipopolysaccharide assembly outer membrane protein LptD (OstA)